ncbi:MAG TPA: hypothetical protein VMJ35_16350 [Dongiaceae bacterium]|nr:hypothetical protein [Dongiaceae bacterium]
MIPFVKWGLLGLVAVAVLVFIGLSVMAGSPKDAFQMVRYAFPYMHRGDLHVGDGVPDVRLVALDGQSRFPLRERMHGKPLVLVFGSFT